MGFNTFPCNPYPISTAELNKGNNDDLNTRVAALESDVSDLDEQKANQITIALPFNPETTYEVGDLVYYNGFSYRCTNEHAGEWDADDFAGTTIANELSTLMSGLTSVSVYDATHISDAHGNINESAFSSGSASIAITGKLATVSVNFVTTKTGIDWVLVLKDAPETKVYFTAYVDSNRVTGYVEYLSDIQIWNVYIPNQSPNSVVSATFTYVVAN